VLACASSSIANTEILNGNPLDNTPLKQYYRNMVTPTVGTVDMQFSNLLRGQSYQLKCILQSVDALATNVTSTTVTINTLTQSDGSTEQLATNGTLATQCVTYKFTKDPGATVKQTLVEYCQKMFTLNGYTNNGCITCTDSSNLYIIPGLKLPAAENSCTVSSAPFRRVLQSATNSTTTTTTNTNTGSAVAFSVCPVPNNYCPSDVAGTFNYYSAIANLTALGSGTNFAKIYNITVPFAGASTSTESGSVNVAGVVISKLTYNATGLVSWTSITSGTSLLCYWGIASTATAVPSFSSIQSCEGPWCGSTKVTSAGVETGTNNSTLLAFANQTTYNIYYACYNDIPGSTTQSSVYAVTKFTISGDVSPSSGNIITLSIGLLFACLLVLFV
jgi:hypothetical protein